MIPEDQLETLNAMCPGAALWPEGGKQAVYLPAFRFPAGGQDRVMDLLLVPFEHTGYETRLFFKEVALQGPVWTQYTVCGNPWWALSWRWVSPSLPWAQILSGHLRAVA